MTMVAALVGEPWCLTVHEVADLTDYQVQQLYAHPRDDQGRLKTKKQAADPEAGPLLGEDLVLSPDEEMRFFFESSKEWGVKREDAEKEWADKRGPITQPPPWLVVLRANWK